MAYQRAWRPLMAAPATSMTWAKASSTSLVKRRVVAGAAPFLPASMAAFTTSSMPRPLSAEVGTTGQPKRLARASTSILSPFFSTRSIILRATTTGMPRSMIWVVR